MKGISGKNVRSQRKASRWHLKKNLIVSLDTFYTYIKQLAFIRGSLKV